MDKCKICDTEFRRKYPRGGQRKIYCSKKCRYADSYIKKTCLTCGKEFIRNILYKKSRDKEFCSLACIQRHPCQLCGKIITGRLTFQSGEKKFCGRACAAFVNRTLKSKIAYVANGFAQTIKKFGKICCERCFIDEINVLCVHHIDKNRKNNKFENLETLCANCHHKEHWGDGIKRKKNIMLAYMISKQ